MMHNISKLCSASRPFTKLVNDNIFNPLGYPCKVSKHHMMIILSAANQLSNLKAITKIYSYLRHCQQKKKRKKKEKEMHSNFCYTP